MIENLIKRSLLIRSDVQNSMYALDFNLSNDDIYDTNESKLPYNHDYTKVGVPILGYDYVSDMYDDLLTVEITVKKLHKYHIINDRQVQILKAVASGMNFNQVASALNLHRQTVAENFTLACRLVSDYLGEHFTVEGYVEYMTDKYKLSNTQKKKLREFIDMKNYTKYRRNNANN